MDSIFICDATLKWWEKKERIQTLPFKVAKGTISRWCREIELTPDQLDRLDGLKQHSWYRNWLKGWKTTQHRRAEEIECIKTETRAEIPGLTQKELWLAGLMLYWAEGNKKRGVSFSNSDPNAVRFMMRWFREICHVPEEKFKIYLNIHSGQSDSAIKKFWSELTGIPISQFGKSYIKKEGTGHRKNVLYNGTIKVTLCNENLLHRIQGWIEGLAQKISGPLAQLEEQGTLNPKAACSNHARPNDLDDHLFVMEPRGTWRNWNTRRI